MVASAFEEGLRLASQLGLNSGSEEQGGQLDASTSNIDACMDVVHAYQSAYEQQAACCARREAAQVQALIDQRLLRQRVDGLNKARDTMARVVDCKDALADRLRAIKVRPSVPVDPQYQPDFTGLLYHSASGHDILRHGGNTLHWAVALDAPPSCWEDGLRAIPDAAKACSDRLAAITGFSEALAALPIGAAASDACGDTSL